MSTENGSPNQLNGDELEFVNWLAKSLQVADVDELARELSFTDAQAMADHYGFKNIFTFFSSPGNAERYADIEIELIAKRREKASTP